MAGFQIDVTPLDSTRLVKMVGSADLSAQATLEREINRLAAGRHPLVVLDLSGLTFIASLAVGQLVLLQQGIKNWGGRVVVANPTPEVQTVLVRCRLTEVLPIFASVEDAMKA